MRHNHACVIFFLLLTGKVEGAPLDPYRITAAEKAACTSDAIALCASAYPNESRLLSCMRSNRSLLSAGCAIVFDAGLKRRRLNESAQK